MKKLFAILFFVPLVLFYSCEKDEAYNEEEQLKKDIALIEEYLQENDLTAQSTESGLYYIIEEQGTGVKPSLQSEVTVAFTGELLNGNVFDNGTLNKYPLNNLIEGWQEGLMLFNEGGKGQLFIPSTLGYGNYDKENIPANSVLIFDIHLQAVWN
ncbi:MAG: FKBP-type peptidyl-prolyl cis-trans isomerase [Bacteroidales bacterium]